MKTPIRLTSDPLPPYAFIPGLRPHPISDPHGHGHFVQEDSSNLHGADSPTFRLGCDLFNHGFYWEAHEAWESLWKSAGRKGPAARFFQGLIHLAAAGVKVRENRPDGVISHARRAQEAFREVLANRSSDSFCGLVPESLLEHAGAVFENPPPCPPDAPVVRVFDFVLLPQE